MLSRLFLITGTMLAAFVGSLSTAEAQFGQRGLSRARIDAPAPRSFLRKPTAKKPAAIDAAKSKRIVVVPPGRDYPPSRNGGGKKPPRGEQAGNDTPPKRTNPRPDRPPQTGDKKPPKRPPVIVIVPPVFDPPPRRTEPPGRERPPRVAKPEPPTRVVPPPPPVIVPPRFASPPLPPLRLLPPLPPGAPPLPGSPPPVAQLAEFVPDELLITVPTAALQQLEMDLAQAFNVSIVERVPLPLIDARLVRLRIPDGRDVPSVVAVVAADPRVLLAQPNFFYRQSNDPAPLVQAATAPATLPGLQYALTKLDTDKAHRTAQGRGAKVAVIDSGIDQSHPDLASAQIEHFDATESDSAIVGELDTHGTGIAGIIAARGGTVQGVAPGSALMSARVFRKSAGSTGASATTVRVLKGMTWSVENGARVLNMSFAGPRDPLVERHVKAVANRGLVSVAAAGNNGSKAPPAFPAAYEEVIAVTAIDANDRLYEQANRGQYVAVSAPGVDVIVPAVGRTHHFQSGTSFAAAHVSGVIALLLEVKPDLTATRLREILAAASDDIGAPGHDPEFGAGRINAARAVELAAK